MDLPFIMSETDTKMHSNNKFDLSALGDPATLACCACLAFMLMDTFAGFMDN
jgi:hypothetical protein